MDSPSKKKPEPPSITQQIAAIPGRILRPGAYFAIVLLSLGAVGAITGISYAGDKFDERTDKRVAPAIKKAIDEHAAEERAKAEARAAALRAEVMAAMAKLEETSARRFEVTINTVLEGRLQPGTRQLSQPQLADLPDAGN